MGCRHCGLVHPPGRRRCTRCGWRLASRFPQGAQRVWAWWLAGLVAYIPANVYPIMITDTLVATYSSTILGGALDLMSEGELFVGAVVIVASVFIPVAKFAAIAFVMLAIRGLIRAAPHLLHRVHAVVELIGRWSMIDVFVVAILSALVHLGHVADIYPGQAAIWFGASVIFTMLSAQSLDPRLIWDVTEEAGRERPQPRRA